MKCRICSKKLDAPLVRLEKMPLTDAFLTEEQLYSAKRGEFLEDIHIYECNQCGFVQNPNNFDFSGYYNEYNYSSGHSKFVKSFMKLYAAKTLEHIKKNGKNFKQLNVLEVGSGDGEQLKEFKQMGTNVFGIEPSAFLTQQALNEGIHTIQSMYDTSILDKNLEGTLDCVLSSFTFDHMPDPVLYLNISHRLLKDGGILTFEVHDLDKIVTRGEFCLFEHEHTIYLSENDSIALVEAAGYKVIDVNPLDEACVRANSLIIYAEKVTKDSNSIPAKTQLHTDEKFLNLQHRINHITNKLTTWIADNHRSHNIVGYGVGGRGIMTLANVKNAGTIVNMLDANYKSDRLFTPKTHIPVSNAKDAIKHKQDLFLIFSFGYFEEITKFLMSCGVPKKNIFSLKEFYE